MPAVPALAARWGISAVMHIVHKAFNTTLAKHPLNWVMVVVVMILFCFVIDAILDHFGFDKPVTANKMARHYAKNGQQPPDEGPKKAYTDYGASPFASAETPVVL